MFKEIKIINFLLILFFVLAQSGQSIIYTFEPNDNTMQWGIITIDETDVNTHNHAMKLNPTQNKTVFLRSNSSDLAGGVKFNWNNHGRTPSIFELVFLIDNESMIMNNNNKINNWIPTEQFQLNYKKIHNLTWYYKLRNNFEKMGKNFWASSCWIDDVEFTGLEVIGNLPYNITSVIIKPENGSSEEPYRYIVYIDGMDEEKFHSIVLEISDESKSRILRKYPIRYNNSCCEFEVNDLSTILSDHYLGMLSYNILFENKSLKQGIGPKINIDWTTLLGKKQSNNKYKYNISVRSNDCPMGITLCYRDMGEKKNAGTYIYDSCENWNSFEWIDQPYYRDFWVVNNFECG